MKKILVIVLAIIIILIINSAICFGASSNTYFYLEAIKIDNQNIEILSNEIFIDTITSKIEYTIILHNASDNDIKTDIKLPLENIEMNTSVRDLIIKLNGVQVNYIKDEDGSYNVKTEIFKNSDKKIEIEYYTENDLQKSKIIKCNFDNLKGKKVDKLKVSVKVDDKNVPLIEKIYPGHYKFSNNIISVEYYNYNVNTITKDFIVKKETFYNLLYGREVELNDEERDIINTWYETGNINVNKQEFRDKQYEKYEKGINYFVENIIDYGYIKNGNEYDYNYEPSEPLLYEMYKGNSDFQYIRDMEGKIVCIDFLESEGDKQLYVSKVTDIQYDIDPPIVKEELIKEKERTILKTNGSGTAYAGKRGARIIFVGEGIDGENLNPTEQEKVEYINQINADMYIRVAIYDGTIKYKTGSYGYPTRIGSGMVGYYDNNNSEIVQAFALCKYDELLTEEIYYNSSYDEEYKPFYSNYEEYAKNYYKDYYKDCVIKLNNEDIANKCEVPTVMQFIGNRVNKDGKYVVEYFGIEGFYDGDVRGLATTNAALQTTQAKQMLEKNKQKNSNKKTEIENKIANIRIVDDEQEIQKEIQDEIEVSQGQEKIETNQINTLKKQKLENKDIIIFASIGIGIMICVVILIIENKKKKEKR